MPAAVLAVFPMSPVAVADVGPVQVDMETFLAICGGIRSLVEARL